jgi:four helix bundle protein
MPESQNKKHYDLEQRTLEFSKRIIKFCNKAHKTVTNLEIIKQLIRAAGSVGANYIEANEALSKKDFVMRVKICRKEAKESHYWLCLIETTKEESKQKEWLLGESMELMKIFGAILEKSK